MQPDIEGFRLLGEYLRRPSRGDEEVVDKAGHRWHIRQRPRPGVRMTMERVEGRNTQLTIYDAATDRPDGYPGELPFMANAVAMVGEVPSTPTAQMVVWSEMPDAREFAQQVQELSMGEGWEITRPFTDFAGFPIAMSELKSRGQRRIVSLMSTGTEAAVTLMQSRDD